MNRVTYLKLKNRFWSNPLVSFHILLGFSLCHLFHKILIYNYIEFHTIRQMQFLIRLKSHISVIYTNCSSWYMSLHQSFHQNTLLLRRKRGTPISIKFIYMFLPFIYIS